MFAMHVYKCKSHDKQFSVPIFVRYQQMYKDIYKKTFCISIQVFGNQNIFFVIYQNHIPNQKIRLSNN